LVSPFGVVVSPFGVVLHNEKCSFFFKNGVQFYGTGFATATPPS
jgi:hypothetical protein